MAQLYDIVKTYRPRRTILSDDMNNVETAIEAFANALGSAPLSGRLGVSTPFSVGDAVEDYHAISKTQFDAATGGFNGQFIVNDNLTVVSGVSVDIHMRGLTANKTITLPQNPTDGQLVRVRDANHTADTYTITLGRNTRKIHGVSSDLSIDVERAVVTLVYDLNNTNWVIAEVSANTDEN
jgi:hypothetical protein